MSLEVALIGNLFLMHIMQFIYKKLTNLFNEDDLRGWLGIDDYNKPFIFFLLQIKISDIYSKEWVIWFDFESLTFFLGLLELPC